MTLWGSWLSLSPFGGDPATEVYKMPKLSSCQIAVPRLRPPASAVTTACQPSRSSTVPQLAGAPSCPLGWGRPHHHGGSSLCRAGQNPGSFVHNRMLRREALLVFGPLGWGDRFTWEQESFWRLVALGALAPGVMLPGGSTITLSSPLVSEPEITDSSKSGGLSCPAAFSLMAQCQLPLSPGGLPLPTESRPWIGNF